MYIHIYICVQLYQYTYTGPMADCNGLPQNLHKSRQPNGNIITGQGQQIFNGSGKCRTVCMNVSLMYECNVCCMNVSLMYECIFACIFACMFACMFVCMYVCIHVCMYVFT